MILSLGILLLNVIHLAGAASSARDVGSDLTLLFQNDLNWPLATQHSGTILVSKIGTNPEALASCRVLNETLMPTEGVNFKSDITSLMRFLAFKDPSLARQHFWVLSSPARPCSAISLQGGIQSVSCSSKLPAFCSQSAPFSLSNLNVNTSPQFQVQVESKKLTVVGVRDALSFRFIGIPYADPLERFTYSKPFSSAATIAGLAYGSRCVQIGGGSEDCLFLNIYTPFLPVDSTKSKDLRPVLFWIHGGAFIGGEGSDGVFDGGNLVSRSDVVVVTINYRLGTLGFLALEDGVTNGNFGIADQITALQWVHGHIADFGGDPQRVTIYGQSAGAGSVRALLAARPAFSLFQGAIAQSNLGGFGFATSYSSYETIQNNFQTQAVPTIQAVGCSNSTDVLACLRAASPQALIAPGNSPKFIVVDGKFITTNQLELNGKGPAAKAHVIFGWMRDDGCDFIGNFPTNTTTLSGALLGAGLPFAATEAVINSTSLFPSPEGPDPLANLFNLTARVGTDGQFRCIDQATLISAVKHNVFLSAHSYQFERSYGGFEPIPGICDPEATPAFPHGNPNLPYFRCHSGELTYMFGTLGQGSIPFRDPGDLILSQVATDIWGSFARTFDPNPSAEYLEARGYTNTTEVLKKSGQWNPVTVDNKKPVRLIDMPVFSDAAFSEEAQCALLGFPLNMFG